MSPRPEDYASWPREKQNAYYAQVRESAREEGLSRGTVPSDVPMGQHMSGAFIPAYRRELKVLDATQLLSMTFPPRSLIMSPWL